MTDNGKKFLFDLNNFDEHFEAEKNKKPPEPTFSLHDMEEARTAAFEKGKQEGAQIAKDSIEQRTEILAQSLAANINGLEQSEQKRREHYTQDMLSIVHKALKTMMPSLYKTAIAQEIEDFLRDFFRQTAPRSNFVLHVHPDMINQITPLAQKIHTDLVIAGDSALSPTTARIEWPYGCAQWNPDDMMHRILDIIAQQVSDPSLLLDESAKNQHTEANEDNSAQSRPTITEEES